MAADERIEIAHGPSRAVFIKQPDGWTPDWFYEDDRPMLRFKDHEWLNIGHVRVRFAKDVEQLDDGGAVFRGVDCYGQTEVAWSVTIRPDGLSAGFVVVCEFTPAASLELLEAYSTFETPYDYTGVETVTTVIGMNPVYRWRGADRQTPPIPNNPAWLYSRGQASRITGPCSAPYLYQSLTDAGATGDRHVVIVGDWNVCGVHDLYCTPTRNVENDPAPRGNKYEPTRGYKYIVGALNWSSAFAKDPNVLYEGGKTHRQRVVVQSTQQMPGASLDEALLAAWQRAARMDIPADGRVEAYDRTTRRGVTWATATKWLRNVFCGDQYTEDLYKPGVGICTYAKGSRPKAGGDYTYNWWPQWSGLLHYRARLMGDDGLEAAAEKIDQQFRSHTMDASFLDHLAMGVATVPTFHWIAGGGRGGVMHEALQPIAERAMEKSAAENGQVREMEYGVQATVAESLLLAAEAYDRPDMCEQALVLLGEMSAKLDENFWEFNCGKTGAMAHGGQIRSLGHGHATVANVTAWRQTGEQRYLDAAQRFARYLVAVSYACHNGSADPDFDWRGWCNGSNAGRDQIAEYPPWETQNGLLSMAGLMSATRLEPAFYDVLWYIGRTGLAQFPAARTLKRVLDEQWGVHYVPREQIASERDFYDNLPYLAYENPHDQTLLASYQGSDCMIGELVYGFALAAAADDRVSALVPRAALLDLAELNERCVHLWNPTAEDIATEVTVTWADGTKKSQALTAPSRRAEVVVFKREG